MKLSRLAKLAATVIAALASAAPIAAQTTQASGLPIVRIDTKDNAPILDKINYVNMIFTLTDPDNPNNNITVVNNTDGIRGRGNTTWGYPKKPYRIKFDKKQSLFGLPAAKSWVLLAEYLDPTLIFNATTFELGNVLNFPYNHTYHHVQLYLNGEYKGVYGVTEQNQAGEGRIDVDTDYGWLIEMDAYYDEEPKFITTNYNLPIMIKSPEIEPLHIGNYSYDFVRNDINELCDSMASVNFPENGYRDLIDMDVFTDFLLINEIVFNNELWHPKSTYLYKDNDSKINMGPLWDFDWAFSYADYIDRYFINYTGRSLKHGFFNRFFEDPVFLAKYKERWNEKYSEIFAVSEFIDDMGTKLETPAAENFNIWQTSNNYAQQITDMKEWWNNRCFWLNSELNRVEVLPNGKTFTTEILGYAEAAAQTFALVSYGDMPDLSAALQKAESSDFEISAELNKTPSGNGGYLAAISVRPKNSLSAGTYTDTLILSGSNQGNPFFFQAPLRFAVKLATPAEVVFPVFNEPIVYNPERTLSEIALNGSGDGIFIWENGGVIPAANVSAYNVIFIPNDPEKYDSSKTILNKLVELTVEKADPPYKLPVGLTATYGDALSSVKLPAGWYWEKGGTVGNAGTQTHDAWFIPADLNNYNVMEDIVVTVTVAKADPVYTIPSELTAAYGDALSSVELPVGWSWEETGTVGNVGTRTHKAKFTPADAANYNFVPDVDVTMTVVKSDPVVIWPNLGAEVGEALSNVLIIGGTGDGTFAWTTPTDSVSRIGGEYEYSMTFTPADSANYNTLTENVTVKVLTGKLIVGPNPATKQSGIMTFFREGKQIAVCELRIYDALGNYVNTVKINDGTANGLLRRKVGAWDLKNSKGRFVSKGTYLAKGVIDTPDGKSNKVSLILGVR